MPVKPAYQGEAQLVRWAESAAAGRTVTLRIDEDDVQHAFKGLKCGDQGQRLHVVVTLVDDNEELQDPETAKKRGHKAPTKPKLAEPLPSGAPAPERSEPVVDKARTPFRELPRSQQAALKCDDAEFRLFVARVYRDHFNRLCPDHGSPTETATDALKTLLGIRSRKELDSIKDRADEWDKLLTSYDYKDRA